MLLLPLVQPAEATAKEVGLGVRMAGAAVGLAVVAAGASYWEGLEGDGKGDLKLKGKEVARRKERSGSWGRIS